MAIGSGSTAMQISGGETGSMTGNAEERPPDSGAVPDASTEDWHGDDILTGAEVEAYYLSFFPRPTKEERAACREMGKRS